MGAEEERLLFFTPPFSSAATRNEELGDEV